ncbi:GNAT family N-acetyltransferase [Robertmurraya korlensis]|uniref:GNAT family N-acetyltransferase n=1 Tax=Robertmurraya korlensis TaxID=519977 RepID=UPI000ACA05D7|nr:GNAT family N-acetyltransferase [Robertmurraya korlensis]
MEFRETQIRKLDVTNKEVAEILLKLQVPSYMVEAKLINFYDIPPLKDTVETLQNCGEEFFGYFIDDDLCGAIAYKMEEKTLDIHRLIVQPNHFRKGIANQLLSFIEEQVEGIDTIIVSTGSENKPAVEFYLNKGFTIEKLVQVNEQLSLTCFEKKIAR